VHKIFASDTRTLAAGQRRRWAVTAAKELHGNALRNATIKGRGQDMKKLQAAFRARETRTNDPIVPRRMRTQRLGAEQSSLPTFSLPIAVRELPTGSILTWSHVR
jgi:hypothetical protein